MKYKLSIAGPPGWKKPTLIISVKKIWYPSFGRFMFVPTVEIPLTKKEYKELSKLNLPEEG